ncbi:MAG TPA: uroporphyrinogen decarboxylase family protein, partial [bacterium]|nr:uroporphyrinogen decarboxylase family protein [bacterium]
PRESTLATWHRQGLPENVNWFDYLKHLLGLPEEPVRKQPVDFKLSFDLIPPFEEKILEHRDGHYVVQDCKGAVVEISDRYDVTYLRSAKDFVTRKWHKFPVETAADWEEMKKRYNPDSPERYPEDIEATAAALKDRDYVLGIGFSGPFWAMRDWCGFEGLCLLMATQPDFVMEMATFWKNFVLKVLDRVVDRIVLDYVIISEDMAYKEKAMVSPAMARKFLVPCWTAWARRLKASGCPIVMVDSDGYIGELIPLWIESGVNATTPVEVAAGNDLVSFRRQFEKKMAYQGGIDKRALAKGGQVMRQELERVIPPLLKDGGYIPGCDHGVPPDISWPNFVEYCRLLARMTGWL